MKANISIITLSLALPFAGSAAVVSLPPAADTFISEWFEGPNGTWTEMVIGTQGAPVNFARNRGLLRFDLSSIPAGSVVSSVTLRVTVNKIALDGGGPGESFEMHRMMRGWSESQSTWSLRLPPEEEWGEPGGLAETDHVLISSGGVFIDSEATHTFGSTPGLVADVTGWLNAPSSNHGWLIKPENESVRYTAGRFASRTGGPDAPLLTVTYTGPVSFRIDTVTVDSGNFCLGFTAEAGKSYIVEHRNDITAGSWATLTNLPAAVATGPVSVCRPTTGAERFFRVGELMP